MTEWFPAGSPTLKQQMEEGRRSMNRIEEIKGRIENYKSEYLPFFENSGEVHEWNAMFGDVQYLLSKLEIAEKALERLSSGKFYAPIEYSQIEAYQKYSESALEQIRE